MDDDDDDDDDDNDHLNCLRWQSHRHGFPCNARLLMFVKLKYDIKERRGINNGNKMVRKIRNVSFYKLDIICS